MALLGPEASHLRLQVHASRTDVTVAEPIPRQNFKAQCLGNKVRDLERPSQLGLWESYAGRFCEQLWLVSRGHLKLHAEDEESWQRGSAMQIIISFVPEKAFSDAKSLYRQLTKSS